ncbi:MAG: PilN domain-containing protein [Vicinamibacteria bacterium]
MANAFNFARAPFVNERLPRLVFAAALFAVAAATLLHGVFLTRYLLREQEALDAQVEKLRKELAETEASITRAQGVVARNRTELGSEQTQFLTRLFRRKSFSWTGLFNELETITPPSVRITSIAPFEEEGQIAVTMTVVGRALHDVLDMVRALESSKFFATVFPLDESNLDDLRGGETGIAATLQLEYVEDVRSPAEPEDLNAPSEETPFFEGEAEPESGDVPADEEAPREEPQ